MRWRVRRAIWERRGGVRRWLLPVLVTVLVADACVWGQSLPPVPQFDFKGKLLVAVSDTDMLASAYLDGKLGPDAGPDLLSVIRLDRPPAQMRAATVPVTNSVTGPPAAVAVTPAGRYAIVVETQGPRPAGKPDARLSELPAGRTITVVDLAEPDKPRVAQQIQSFERALSVSINARGDLVAVAYGDAQQGEQPRLALFHFKAGRLSAAMTPPVPGMGPGDALLSAEFHPKQDVLGLVYTRNPRIAFVAVEGSGETVSLTAWGNPVAVDPGPFLIRYTPDGRYGIVNAMYIGADIRGTVSSIRIDGSKDAHGKPHHELVSRADTGAAPEGLAVSPDGRWLATTNLERSAYPVDDPHQGFFSSVTLLRLNPETGSIDRVGDFPFEGILPEAAVFDNSSRFLAVTCFDHFAGSPAGGSIDFWRISGDYADPKRIELVKTGYSVPVARGPQSMAIVR